MVRRGTPRRNDVPWPTIFWFRATSPLPTQSCQLPGKPRKNCTAGSPRACTAVTCGPEGCYYLQPSEAVREVQHLPAPRVESLETTGCGDVFHGAYAAALVGSKDILECLRFASAAAAAFATRPSGWQHIPTTADVDRLISKTYG